MFGENLTGFRGIVAWRRRVINQACRRALEFCAPRRPLRLGAADPGPGTDAGPSTRGHANHDARRRESYRPMELSERDLHGRAMAALIVMAGRAIAQGSAGRIRRSIGACDDGQHHAAIRSADTIEGEWGKGGGGNVGGSGHAVGKV